LREIDRMSSVYLKERFLNADEKLEELPNPQMPAEEKQQMHAQHLIDILVSSLASCHGLLAILQNPVFAVGLPDIMDEGQITSLKKFESDLDQILRTLDPETYAEAETIEDEEESGETQTDKDAEDLGNGEEAEGEDQDAPELEEPEAEEPEAEQSEEEPGEEEEEEGEEGEEEEEEE